MFGICARLDTSRPHLSLLEARKVLHQITISGGMPSGKRRGALLYFVLPRPFVELQLHRVEALVDMRFNQNVH